MDLASPHWPFRRRLEEHQETGNNIQDARDSSTKNRDVVTSVVIMDALPGAVGNTQTPTASRQGASTGGIKSTYIQSLSAISSCSVSDSAGVIEGVGRKYRFLPESKGCTAESLALALRARARDDGCTSRR